MRLADGETVHLTSSTVRHHPRYPQFLPLERGSMVSEREELKWQSRVQLQSTTSASSAEASTSDQSGEQGKQWCKNKEPD